MSRRTPLGLVLLVASAIACSKKPQPSPAAAAADAATPGASRHDRLPRLDVNRWAVRLNLPLYWIVDADKDGDLDPREVATLLFYPSAARWVDESGERFTPAFEAAYQTIVDAAAAPPPAGLPAEEAERRRLVALDLDGGRATLVLSDLAALPAAEQRFLDHMLTVAARIDSLYETQLGLPALASRVPDDAASQSLFRRNRGPLCVTPQVEAEPGCTAVPGVRRPPVDVYPTELQADERFCAALEARKDAEALLGPFTVVREQAGKLTTVPYHQAYASHVAAIAAELRAAADALPAEEAPLAAYLRAAAAGFESDDWTPADEAWARMNAESSAWYVRVAPDETYWEPCAHKAGYHLTLARINRDSLAWQRRLGPVLQQMEAEIAAKAGPPYRARQVAIHLPDFIDIVVNAGDDRFPLGATIGQSLPNWGPVANQGRGRTVAMSNLYTDPDSLAARRAQAASLLDAQSLAGYVDEAEPGLLGTILHEAAHNLGPSHEYQVRGKTDEQAFGGPLAAVMEELKAQSAALHLFGFLADQGILGREQAARGLTDSIVWALGHVAEGMTTPTGEPKTYAQLAAIQVGFLLDEGALTWDADAPAANGQDKGAFTIHMEKLPAASAKLLALVAGIKARGDRKAAEALVEKYVRGKVVPHAVIVERWGRQPRASFVYAVSR